MVDHAGALLITGGSGFFGGLLKKRLLNEGHFCVNIDLEADDCSHPRLTSIRGDIRDEALLESVCAHHSFHAVFHCAAILAHEVKDKDFLWSCNVEGTHRIAEAAAKHGIRKIVYTSSNCLWGHDFGRPVRETDEPQPVEIYGKSKWEGEKILRAYRDRCDAVIFRCPTIMDSGRLGLLAILFEFIDEGRRVWTVGGGHNRYQFIYAQDLIDACLSALAYEGSDVFNIGSDDVKTFKEVYEYVIDKAATGARVASLPRRPTILAMRIAHAFGLSPLGPYQYKMIAENFVFDTTRIKQKLHWAPSLTNEEMLYRAYAYYHENRAAIAQRTGVSAHKRAARMGVIRLLKCLS
jgi:UDP-glucose 4-epimerase